MQTGQPQMRSRASGMWTLQPFQRQLSARQLQQPRHLRTWWSSSFIGGLTGPGGQTGRQCSTALCCGTCMMCCLQLAVEGDACIRSVAGGQMQHLMWTHVAVQPHPETGALPHRLRGGHHLWPQQVQCSHAGACAVCWALHGIVPSLSNPCCLLDLHRSCCHRGRLCRNAAGTEAVGARVPLLHAMLPAAITYKVWRSIAAAPSSMEQVSRRTVQLVEIDKSHYVILTLQTVSST